MELSAVILAGGQSRRMGFDKAWLELDGQALVARAVQTVRRVGVKEVFVSGRRDEDYSELACPVLLDLEPGFGPIAGIERALHAASNPLLLVLAVDLPHMNADFLRRLASHCDDRTEQSNGVVEWWSEGVRSRINTPTLQHSITPFPVGAVPELDGRLEPLAAIYPKRCHGIALEFISRSRHAARDFAQTCISEGAVRTFASPAEDARCFINWNTPQSVADYDAVLNPI